MALDLPVAELIRSIGHDGSEILWDNLPEPMCRRGFHSQELIAECLERRHGCTPIEVAPAIGPTQGDGVYQVYGPDVRKERLLSYITCPNTVIECEGKRYRHTIHGRQGHIFDPAGREYECTDLDLFNLEPYRIWIIT